MLTSTLPFPTQPPDGYAYAEDEPRYDPAQHLSLEFPDRIWSLEEFGYDPEVIASCASPVALTSPFRILSDEGVRILHQILSQLKAQRSTLSDDRTASYLAGGVYRSKFLRDFCACPVVLEQHRPFRTERLDTTVGRCAGAIVQTPRRPRARD